MRPPLYGLDIETDTSVDGLDPRVAAVLAIGLWGPEGGTVIRGSETGILRALDGWLAEQPAGVIVTWNGARFDLPFLADRAARTGVPLGLELRPDPTIELHHGPLAGHDWGYRARWHGHRHVDAYRAYRAISPEGESCALKAVAAREGLAAVLVDAAAIHTLDREAMRRYVQSDATLAWQLAHRRWSAVARFIDQPVAYAS